MFIWVTVIVFVIAALIGLTMAIAAFRNRFPPVASAVVHGIFAAAGLVLLIITVAHGASGGARWALALLLLAAIGGFVMALGYHARKRSLPKNFVAGHAVLAVIGLLLLLAAALRLFWPLRLS